MNALPLLLTAALTITTATASAAADTLPQFHTLTLDFAGPETSEDATPNPFTDTRLLVDFTHGGTTTTVRGFFAADGDAANTGATAGNTWRVRFTPDKPGRWTYRARLATGTDLAISRDPTAGTTVDLERPTGQFDVTAAPADTAARDFRHHGRLTLKDGYFYFPHTGRHFIKGGTNSPENFLAYTGFDATFRTLAEARDGEAAAPDYLHSYPSHAADWQPGDPTWRDGKGKSIIGATNYLAAKGLNSAYFLTLNIGGDGKDVWPYTDPDTFDRFDVSKLAQWEILFAHMQRQGILLHVVTQETENERLLDGGDTGRLRKLYYHELIARFGHHLALVWNLGEENGPAHFSPDGQTPPQQKAMASFFAAADPYDHPVFLHTHATDKNKEEGLPPLLGHRDLDALSFQVNKPDTVNAELQKWHAASAQAGHRWAIAMDEIGPWQHGAVPDADDPTHDHLRHHVLWGALLGAAAGIEWYFGAHHDHNDLTNEDFRTRDTLWSQTAHATRFVDAFLPVAKMAPHNNLVPGTGGFCLADPGQVYAVYLPAGQAATAKLDLQAETATFTVHWFDPRQGGPPQTGTTTTITGPGPLPLGTPPTDPTKDWVALIRRAP